MRLRQIIIAILLLLPLVSQAEITFPSLTGRVVDNAGIIDAPTKAQLESTLTAHEQKTSNQIVVVTLKSLQGYEIEEFGYQLGRKWGIGTKEKNNGVLFIIAPNEHKTRIEVGYGLEGNITDALSKIIIENDIIPLFKQGNYSTGILNGTDSIIKALGGSYIAPSPKHNNSSKPNKLVLELIIFACTGLWVLLNQLFLKNKTYPSSNSRKNKDSDSWDGGGFGGGSSRGGSGSDFGGGGGSFGGGGSSGSW